MALTPFVRSPEATTISVFRRPSTLVASPEAMTIAVFNFPTEEIRVPQANVFTVFAAQMAIQATQAWVVPVYRGPVENVKLRAWTFSLDAHDFWVLKLGTGNKTLVLDLTTKQWSYWSSSTLNRWRASIGMNWRSAGTVPSNYGTNVIVGDDSTGILWVLNPLQGYDDALQETSPSVPVIRSATGQMVIRGRQSIPVYSAYLTADLGAPGLTANTVTLEYSDDQGRSYITADTIQVSDLGNYNQEFVWRSLGQVRAPGRLFRITDTGAFARIDGLDINI